MTNFKTSQDKRVLDEFALFLRSKPYSFSDKVVADYKWGVWRAVKDNHCYHIYALIDELDSIISCSTGRVASALKKFKEFVISNYGSLKKWAEISDDIQDIHEKAHSLTGQTSDPYLVRVFEKRRKKDKASWLRQVFDFLERCEVSVPSLRNRISILDFAVRRELTADRFEIEDADIRNGLDDLLLIVIGEYYGKSPAVCDEAKKYLDELRSGKVTLIFNLLGEYIDGLLTGPRENLKDMDERRFSRIVLFVDNIKDSAKRSGLDYHEVWVSVLAHEYLHFHHYYAIYKDYYYQMRPALALQEFLLSYPAEVIKESLADYFQAFYSDKRMFVGIGNKLRDEWKRNEPQFWPYAGARNLDKVSFRGVFNQSVESVFSGSAPTLNDVHLPLMK